MTPFQKRDGVTTRLIDIYWMAGLLEGEGCFGIKSRNKLPIITYVTTDFDSALRVCDFFRSSMPLVRKYKTSPTSKQVYSVSIHGRRAVGWMLTIYPIMGTRRKVKIRELIRDWRG